MAYITDVYLSEILKKDVVNQFGRKVGVLWDLSIVPGTEYPSVTRLILRKGRQFLEAPVQYLQLFNRFVITVDLSGVTLASYSFQEGDILVKKHILDKSINLVLNRLGIVKL